MDKTELFEHIKKHPNGNVQEHNFKKKYPVHYDNICRMSFPDGFTFQQKLFHYFNDDFDLKLGLCPVCGNRCRYRRINEGYNEHCSVKCSSLDKSVKDKVKETNVLRYGVEYSSMNQDVKDKRVKTNLERYGFTNPAKSESVIEKIAETNMRRYGRSNYAQTEMFIRQHKKRVLFDGIWFDSDWERIVYEYSTLCGKVVEYSPDISFEYEYEGNMHYYHPDFKIDGILYEVKGDHFFENGRMINPFDRNMDGLYEAKRVCMVSNGIIILHEKDIRLMDMKMSVLKHLNVVDDKSGGLKKSGSIRKNHPEMYGEIVCCDLPEHFTFPQRLWHYLRSDFSIHVCKCGKELKFIDFKRGYRTYCSKDCPCLVEHNMNTIGKAQVASRSKESRQKAVKTICDRNGGQFWSDENLERLRSSYFENYEERNKKIRETIKKSIKEFNELSGKSISGCSSIVEMEFYKYLIGMFGFDNVEPQYIDKERYPFACDFHINGIDIFIEINGTWTHGPHPFDSENEEDLAIVDSWNSKSGEYYDNAIYTWTDLDVRKLEYARKNGLNHIEIYSHEINECISLFEKYLTDMVVGYCMTKELPGTDKWVNTHPIWDGHVGNRISPREGWSDERCLRKAFENILYMCKKDDDFKVKHMSEFLMCSIVDGRIVSSTDRFLKQIQNRFTIAKIAPKVTAISGHTVKGMIDESGIDVSCGVYVPMVGFGGIPVGVKMWGDERGIDIEVECYDINERLCEWYGWTKRDMLSCKVKTDKVCIVCPPFGKEYEHWDGTPYEMSSTTFKEWYRLVKEHVDAPEYIIIGPEIGDGNGVDGNGKEYVGLFKKTSGVMIWNDEMIKNINKI